MDFAEVSWKSLSIYLNGVLVTRVRGLRYKPMQESEYIRGAGDEPIDINTGDRSYIGELKVLKSLWDKMNDAAIAAGAPDALGIAWTIVATYKATLGDRKRTVTLPNVVLEEGEEALEGNSKEMVIAMPFKCLQPIRS